MFEEEPLDAIQTLSIFDYGSGNQGSPCRIMAPPAEGLVPAFS
jgi:hypothetical protein